MDEPKTIEELNNCIFELADELSDSELKALFDNLVLKGCYPQNYDGKCNLESVKEGLGRISIEDLDKIAPAKIKKITSQFLEDLTAPVELKPEEPEPQNTDKLPNGNDDRNNDNPYIYKNEKDLLIKEALRYASGRSGKGGRALEIRNRERMGYVLAKLFYLHRMPKKTIAELIGIGRDTCSIYVDRYLRTNSEIAETWGTPDDKGVLGKIYPPEPQPEPQPAKSELQLSNESYSNPPKEDIPKPETKSETQQEKERQEDIMNSLEESGQFIQPDEYILHDTPRRLLESVWVLEGLHKKSNQERANLPFSNLSINARGEPVIGEGSGKSKENKVVSLIDLSVYFLMEKWVELKRIDDTINNLNEQIIALSVDNYRLSSKITELVNDKEMLMKASALAIKIAKRR